MTWRLLGFTSAGWMVVAVCLGATACFPKVDVSKLKCKTGDNCPDGHTCSKSSADAAYGQCVPKGSNSTGSGGQSGVGGTGSGSQGGAGGTQGSGGSSGGGAFAGSSRSSIASGSGGTVVETSVGGGVAGGSVGSGGETSIPTGGNSQDSTSSSMPLGSSCTDDWECGKAFCVDGVCCESKCEGQCQACNEKDSPGRCVAVEGEPRGERLRCSGTAPCKGQCDGKSVRACTAPDSSTICSQASCVDGQLTPASYCDGSGVCPKVSPGPCASKLCASDGKACVSSCAGVSCGENSYCEGTTCVPKKTSGACSLGTECVSGYCADGVCCNTPCTEQCRACNLSGSSGTCTRVGSGVPAKNHTPCSGSGTCAGVCTASADSCVYPDASQTCGTPAACATDLSAVNSSACDGKGSCLAASKPCGSSSYCQSSTTSCVSKANSGACTSNVQCASGNCSTGICCPVGQTNSNGVCCATGLTGCNGQCVDISSNKNYCGSCTNACTGGRGCTSGSCTCAAPTTDCGASGCINVNASDSNHCGTCTTTCSGGKTCSAGACGCPTGTSDCGSAGCININGSDAAHCGSCSKACGTGQTCNAGTCACPFGAAFACGRCLAWDFETASQLGGTQGWSINQDASTGPGISNITLSQSYRSSGAQSLALTIYRIGEGGYNAPIKAPLCLNGGSVNLAGYTFHARVLVTGMDWPSSYSMLSTYQADGSSADGTFIGVGAQSASVWKDWTLLWNFTTPAGGIGINFVPAPGDYFYGTIYVDDIYFTAP